MTPKTALSLLAVLTATGTLALGSAGALAAATGGASAPAAGTPSTSSVPATEAAPAPVATPATGIATWYGPGLYGRRTACGQVLMPLVVGVANRTLPCGTLVKMTYGGRSLVVPVLDRGPYGHTGAEWDLTAGAAAALGVTETVHIAARVVGSTPVTAALGAPTGTPAEELAGGVPAAEAASASAHRHSRRRRR